MTEHDDLAARVAAAAERLAQNQRSDGRTAPTCCVDAIDAALASEAPAALLRQSTTLDCGVCGRAWRVWVEGCEIPPR